MKVWFCCVGSCGLRWNKPLRCSWLHASLKTRRNWVRIPGAALVLPEVTMAAGTATLPREEVKVRRQPPYNVVLVNDDDHTVDYVVDLMQGVFGRTKEAGVQVAKEVHEKGRCIVWTGAMEVAELKQEQIHAFGPDKRLPKCKGSMTAELEPAA